MRKKEYSLHTLCLAAIFLVGNAAVTIPYAGADRNTFLGFLISALIALPIFCTVAFLLNRLKIPPQGAFRTLLKATGLILSVFILLGAAVCFRNYRLFVSRDMLPKTPAVLISIGFAVSVLMLVLSPHGTLLKFSLFSFILTAVITGILFAASLPRLNPDTVILLRKPEPSEVYEQTKPYLLNVFIPALPVLLYERQVFGRVRIKRSLWGVALGSVVLGLCLLGTLMLFGAAVAAELEFPYAASISTVTVGNLFTRMDGFAYFVYFAGCIIKISASISVVKSFLEFAGFKYKKTAGALCTAAVMMLSFFK